MLTAHLSVKLKFLTRCKQKVVLLQFQHGGQYKSYVIVLQNMSLNPFIRNRVNSYDRMGSAEKWSAYICMSLG